LFSSILNIAYFMPIVGRAFFLPLPKNERRNKIREAPMLCVVPLCLTAAGSLLLFFFADHIYRLLAPIAFP
jgi:multicomponent Na+:H+ antiporter subunit D